MANCKIEIPEYQEIADCSQETGRVVAVAFVDESINFGDGTGGTTDITLAANWTGLVYEADILIYQEVRGAYPIPSPTEIAGKGKQDVRVTGRKHELTFFVDNVAQNWDHFNKLNKSTNYKMVFIVGSNYDKMFHVDTNVNINAGTPIEEGLDSELNWQVVVKWDDIDIPRIYTDVPAGIFED